MQNERPLSGIRVLEAGSYISGPYTGSLLASLGADVVKIEPPTGGDPFRRGVEISSPYFVQYNAGKRSLAVDLKRPDGVALIKALVPHYDVFVENARPGKMSSLGLGPEELMTLNPRLVYSSASGFGDGGEYRDRAAYDSMGQSMAGYYSIMNDRGTPRLTGTCVADLITGIVAAMGVLAGLVARGLNPKQGGMLAQTSLLEAMSTITIDALTQLQETNVTPTRESRHPQAQNFCLLTATEGSITLHLSSSEKFWQALTRAMERTDLLADPRFRSYADRMSNYFELKQILEKEFLTRTQKEWESRLLAADVPYAPVLTLKELTTHPQTQWLELLEPDGEANVLVRAPWRFFGKRPARSCDAPLIGQHTREIAAEVLSPAEIERLLTNGTVYHATRVPAEAL